MPTYEYQCEKCEDIIEEFQQMTDSPLETCTREGCGGKLKKLMGSGAGLIFKGSGFYTPSTTENPNQTEITTNPVGDRVLPVITRLTINSL